MIEGILIKLAILSALTISAFIFGYLKGKNSQKIKQLESNIQDAIQTKKRRKSRKSDDIVTIKRRMRRYTIG